jgi:hypothetical protein
MAITWHVSNFQIWRKLTMIPLTEFFKTAKGIAVAIGIAIVLFFLIFREINKQIGENENENIEIETITIPKPFDFESNCVRLTGQPCPRTSK